MKDRLSQLQQDIDARREHRHDAEKSTLEHNLRTINRQYQDLIVDYQRLKNDFDLVSGFQPDQVAPVEIKPLSGKANDESVAVANASDWHAMETVRPEEVNGLNEYTPAICEKSVAAFFQGVLRWVEIHRSGTQIKQLMLNLLGDLMTGQLHDDQAETNSGTPEEEVLFLMDLLIGGIDMLLSRGGFDQLIINAVDGNHGRSTEKMRVSNRVKHSREWLLYKLLQRWYRDEKRIAWNIAAGQHLYVNLYGRTLRLHHGDGIRYAGGVGDITIPILKAIKQWNTGRPADLDIFGHWHTMIDDSRFVSNGSILGYAPYSIKIKAPYQPPQQSLLILNKKRWITSFNRIYVR